MITQIPPDSGCDGQWVLQPTRSMTWREAKVFIAAVALVSIGIGMWFFVQGFPLVLPFSGLETLAVAAAFYTVMREGENREVVSLFPRQLVVEKGRRRADVRAEFDRLWVRVELVHSPRRWYPSRLLLTSHGRPVELGRFLTNGEREALASALDRAIEEFASPHPSI
jgi:uncharacterized membrane protein